MRIRLKLIFYVLAKVWAYGETHLRIIWTTERSIYQSSSSIRIWTESLRAAFDQYIDICMMLNWNDRIKCTT